MLSEKYDVPGLTGLGIEISDMGVDALECLRVLSSAKPPVPSKSCQGQYSFI